MKKLAIKPDFEEQEEIDRDPLLPTFRLCTRDHVRSDPLLQSGAIHNEIAIVYPYPHKPPATLCTS